MVMAEFSIVPLDKGESLSSYIAQVMELIDESGLDYQFTPMATIVEGEFEEVLDLIKSCHLKMREVSNRVITTIKLDDREGARGRIKGKVESVEKKAGRKLKK